MRWACGNLATSLIYRRHVTLVHTNSFKNVVLFVSMLTSYATSWENALCWPTEEWNNSFHQEVKCNNLLVKLALLSHNSSHFEVPSLFMMLRVSVMFPTSQVEIIVKWNNFPLHSFISRFSFSIFRKKFNLFVILTLPARVDVVCSAIVHGLY